jgi:hypothetical protein
MDSEVLENNKTLASVSLELREIANSRNDYIRIPEIQSIISELINQPDVQNITGLSDLLRQISTEFTAINDKVNGQFEHWSILNQPGIFTNEELSNASVLLNDIYDRMAGVHKIDSDMIADTLRDLRKLIIKILSVALTRPLVYSNSNTVNSEYTSKAKNAIRHAKNIDIRDEDSRSASIKLGYSINDTWIDSNELKQAA